MSSKSAVLEMGEDDLDFHESTHHEFNSVPDSALDNDDDADDAALLGDGDGNPSKTSNFLSFAFYQQFFDVDSDQVKNRILWSMIPSVKGGTAASYLETQFRKGHQRNPDLYGPFWICVTLVFSTAISGNLASYLQTALNGQNDFKWHYDFHKVTLAASAVFTYAWIVPAVIYSYLWYAGGSKGSNKSLTFTELLSLYGYSLAIYIPVSILWVIQLNALQWLLVLLGAGLSGSVLCLSLWSPIKEKAEKSATLLMIIIIGLHFLLAVGFMLYFFHVPSSLSAPLEQDKDIKVVPPVGGDDKKNDEEKEADKAKLDVKVKNENTEKEDKKNDEKEDKRSIENIENDSIKDGNESKNNLESNEKELNKHEEVQNKSEEKIDTSQNQEPIKSNEEKQDDTIKDDS